ncbi:DUF4430 domain-containing protein [Candidatus Giovannonibacteria bacterium]|nr:DUF4430 domain-containing protein [Candidatus Giovannonibacteria bacterium]
MSKNIRNLLFGVLVLIVVGVGAWVYFSKNIAEKSLDSTKQVSELKDKATIIFSFDENESKKFENIEFNRGENLLAVTQRVAKNSGLEFETKDYGDLGKLITKIEGKENGTDGKYWQYLINGKYAEIGASAYELKNGDKIEWQFKGQ